MLYIHPEECIDCGACVPACPVAAIYESIDATPSHQKDLIEANAVYRNGDADAMAQAEAIVQAHVAAQPALMAIPAAERQAAHANPLKIATWNVNGIRARQAQVQEWIERERPDVVCLQEIKATSDQVPDRPLRDGGLLVLLARRQGLLRRRAPRQQDALRPSGPPSPIPPSTTKTASSPSTSHAVGDADRRVDLRAERRQGLPRQDAVPRGDGRLRARRSRRAAGRWRCCGDMNVARTERDVHPKERKPRAIGQLPEERALIERIIGRGLVDVGRALDPGQRRPVHLVGAVAQHAAAQHRLAPRLRVRERRARRARDRLPGAEGRRHERSRAGRGDVRAEPSQLHEARQTNGTCSHDAFVLPELTSCNLHVDRRPEIRRLQRRGRRAHASRSPTA